MVVLLRATRTPLFQIVLLAIVYTVVARLGLLMDAVSGFATLVWPPTGIALAALVALGYGLWPGVLLGAFATNLLVGAPALVALGIACGNTLEAIAGAYVLRRLVGVRASLVRLNDALALIFVVATLTTAVSATVGVACLRAGGVVPAAATGDTWRAWWIGDALGDLLVGSLLLAWNAPARDRLSGARRAEAGALAGFALVLAWSLFFRRSPSSTAGAFVQAYALFPVLVWGAVRFGLRGATLATFGVAAVAIGGTALGGGPFVRETLAHSLLLLQLFMAIVSATGLVLGAAISERTGAVRSRDEILAIASHDLRNPLSAARMSVSAAERAIAREDRAAALRHLAVAERASGRMEALIQDLVDLAALDAGRFAARRAETDAGLALRDAVEGMRPLAEEAGVTLDGAACEQGPPVRCDYDRVLQVFSNLLGNAVRHTPRGGRIAVSATRAEGSVRFEVEDTGSGIAPDELPHVFDRFRRGANVTGAGLGLGLYIARGIVEAYGGSIGAQSRAGEGSVFYFTLPVVTDAGARSEPASAPEHATHRA